MDTRRARSRWQSYKRKDLRTRHNQRKGDNRVGKSWDGEQECITQNTNPFLSIPGISKLWWQIGQRGPNFWEAPEGLFWLWGETAYVTLPGEWAGSCTLEIIRPSFFLLPQNLGGELGVPLYDELVWKKMKFDWGNPEMAGLWVAPWEDHRDLWPCHLGPGHLMGVQNSNLYVTQSF